MLQSCMTLCDHRDSSPPGSPVPGILQARTLDWVAISFSNAWKRKVKVRSLSHVRLSATPWTAAHQAPPSMGFSRQEYWSGVPLPSPATAIRAAQTANKGKNPGLVALYTIFTVFWQLKSSLTPKVANFTGNMSSSSCIGSAFSQVGPGSSCHLQREWCLPPTPFHSYRGSLVRNKLFFSWCFKDSLFLTSDYKCVLL